MNLRWLRALFCSDCMQRMQFPQDLGFWQNTVFQKLASVFQNCLILVCVITYFHLEHCTFANGSCLWNMKGTIKCCTDVTSSADLIVISQWYCLQIIPISVVFSSTLYDPDTFQHSCWCSQHALWSWHFPAFLLVFSSMLYDPDTLQHFCWCSPARFMILTLCNISVGVLKHA